MQERDKKVEALDKMLNESMEELQQKDKNLKEKESKVVELDTALKERQWELKQKADQVKKNTREYYKIMHCFFLVSFSPLVVITKEKRLALIKLNVCPIAIALFEV